MVPVNPMDLRTIRQMDMSYSYKPVLLCADDKGRVKLDDIVSFFRSYYEGRRSLVSWLRRKTASL
jgi:hypothetical protein